MLFNRATQSGLVVAEEVIGEPALKRALREIDPRLSLQLRPPYYVVVCQVSDYYAPVIATWMDLHGNPLPLSSGLVEKVRMWRLDGRNQPETVEEFNARRQAELAQQRDAALDALADDHRPYIERGRTQVTLADTGKPRYWRRDGAMPRSGAPK